MGRGVTVAARLGLVARDYAPVFLIDGLAPKAPTIKVHSGTQS